MVIYGNYIGLCRFYRYVVNIGRWSPYEGGQLDRFHCITQCCILHSDIIWQIVFDCMYMWIYTHNYIHCNTDLTQRGWHTLSLCMILCFTRTHWSNSRSKYKYDLTPCHFLTHTSYFLNRYTEFTTRDFHKKKIASVIWISLLRGPTFLSMPQEYVVLFCVWELYQNQSQNSTFMAFLNHTSLN